MKMFTNLPGSLRFLFDVLRVLTVFFAAVWGLVMISSPLMQRKLNDGSKLSIAVGDVMFRIDPAAVKLQSNSASPGSLELYSLRGSLKMDLLSQDANLVSALRRTVLPVMVVLVAFSWVLFTALRNICANIEKGEVFTGKNQRLIRNVGLILIFGSVAGAAVGLWASHVMGVYLNHHVTLLGIPTSGQPIIGAEGVLDFIMPSGLFSAQSGLVTGLLVLVISEAFRQGLALKTENDLTV
jgi:hypothetical protein